MAVVHEEFGPTLPELVAPRLGLRTRTAWRALAGVLAVALAVTAWLVLRPDPNRTDVLVREPVTFNLQYTRVVHRAPPRPGEVLRLQTRSGPPQSVSVRPLHLGTYRGDVSATMTLMAARLIDEMAATYPGFVHRGDGRVSLSKQPGYQILFQARIGGRTTYGKRVLLVGAADPPPREGLDLTFLAERSPAVPNVDAVATNGALEIPYRTLRFGTDRA
ncbi:MAG TPA: hypothetical protein VF257_18870 [Solirubrobacteraceae bacterium]